MKSISLVVAVLILSSATSALAQVTAPDSLSVKQAVEMTLKNHPAVQQAEYGITATQAGIAASRSELYPNIGFNGEYTRIGPVPSFELPGQGSLELAPRNNYNLGVRLEHTLYDFGRTKSNIQLAETSHQTAADNVERVKSGLAYETIGVFNNILLLHHRIAVLDDQLQTLNQHLVISVKKMAAGTATDFDTLTIEVKVAVVRSERIDVVRALNTQEIMLRQLTGLNADAPINLRGDFSSDELPLNRDSLTAVADKQRPELILAHDAESSATARMAMMALGDKPLLALSVAAGFANGYEPNLNTWRGNYVAGVNLKVPFFNGHRTKHLVEEAKAELKSAQEHTSDVKLRVNAEVLEAVAAVNSNLEKIASAETQVHQAEKAVSMARVRYNAGVITNLDLLDAETTLSQAKLIHLRALYDYTVSLNSLDRATGKKVW